MENLSTSILETFLIGAGKKKLEPIIKFCLFNIFHFFFTKITLQKIAGAGSTPGKITGSVLVLTTRKKNKNETCWLPPSASVDASHFCRAAAWGQWTETGRMHYYNKYEEWPSSSNNRHGWTNKMSTKCVNQMCQRHELDIQKNK